jgi:hypothetical protein
MPFDPRWASAISGIESSGRYNLVGPDNGKGNKPYGKYQVMDFNVGPWTRDALGREMSPQDFLNDPDAQDAVFRHQFGKNVEKYGSPQEAASVWFSGRPMAQAGNARDILGTTVPGYISKFNKAMGNPGVNAIEAAMGKQPSQPSTGAAMAFDTTPPPDDGFLGQIARYGGNASNGGYTLADALGNAGVAMMSLDNAKGAAALGQNMALNYKQRAAAQKPSEFQYDPKSGTFFRTNASGKLETMQNPNANGAEGKPLAKISESSLKNVAKTIDDYDFINSTAGQAADILDDLKTGKLDLGMLKNGTNTLQNMAGMSDDKSRAYARYTRFVQDLVNSNLRLNNGVQTEGDAWRELKAIAANGTSYDNKTAAEALERVIDKAGTAAARGRAHLESRKATFGPEPFEGYSDTVNGWQSRLDAINERRKGYAKPAEAAPAAPGKARFLGIEK